MSKYRNKNDSAVATGILYCDTVLRIDGCKVNKMVVMTDGRNSLSGKPVFRANNFRPNVLDGKVTSVDIRSTVQLDVRRKISDTPGIQVDQWSYLVKFVKQMANLGCAPDMYQG